MGLDRFFRAFFFNRVVFRPSQKDMLQQFRSIYVALLTCDDKTGLNSANDILRDLVQASSRWTEARSANVVRALGALKYAAGVGAVEALRGHVPLAVQLHHFKNDTRYGDITERVVAALRSAVIYSDNDFCEELLRKGSFVFLFSVAKNSGDLVRELRAFFDTTNRHRNYLLIVREVPPNYHKIDL